MPGRTTVASVLAACATTLLFMVAFSLFVRGGAASGGGNGDGFPAPPAVAGPDNARQFASLQQSVEAMTVVQQRLLAELAAARQRLARLESVQGKQGRAEPLVVGATEDRSPSGVAIVDVLEQEQRLATDNQDTQHFESLQYLVFSDGYDTAWAEAMETAFGEVEQRLQALDSGATTLSIQRCGARACLVEITYGAAPTDAGPALLAARGASEVVFRHVEDGDSRKTLAIYLR